MFLFIEDVVVDFECVDELLFEFFEFFEVLVEFLEDLIGFFWFEDLI